MGNKDKSAGSDKDAREAKLARALRDNLKRRKAAARDSAAARPAPKPPADQDS